MTASWGSELTRLTALALVIATSPITVIPAVLVLHAPRPRPTGLAFLGGWLLGLGAATAAFISVSDKFSGLTHSPPTWASWLRVVLGSALIVFGIYRWVTRRNHAHVPAWMSSFSRLTPPRAGVTGAVLAVVRPEVLIICAVAGLGIGTNGLGAASDWISGVFFVVMSSLTVIIPIVAYAGAGARLDDPLERLKVWMEENSAALVAVVLVLIGLMVLYNGVRAL
ncbi:membrane protein [Mycobacterium bourgelatii]|uniref:Membrane protein n=1 Tax=Mycobacterium bourgelatii TaxID=1273442 RepID=A0A7I9YWE7_MYCBU|nr:membrane protein [Mycobacterium bourgelatii]